MKMQPLITVITPAYNSQFLFEAISSVAAQTYPKIEYIVTDDGTPFFDREKVEAYIEQVKRDNMISYKVMYHEQNVGTVKNLNDALKQSHGDYLFNLAADDQFVDAYVLERWVREMQDKKADFCVACLQHFDETMTQEGKCFPLDYQKKILLSGNSKVIFRELAMGNFIYGCVVARSRKCLENFGFYDENYRLVEDYPYVLSYVRQNGKIDFFDEVVIRYREGGTSSSGRFNPAYEKDSDEIVKREILPYVSNKKFYRRIYFQWKSNQKTGFWNQSKNAGKMEKIVLYGKNPVQLYIRLRQMILQKIYK